MFLYVKGATVEQVFDDKALVIYLCTLLFLTNSWESLVSLCASVCVCFLGVLIFRRPKSWQVIQTTCR